MHRKITLLFILIFTLSSALFAAPDYYAEDLYITTGVDSGLGGPYPTDTEGLETIFANPASFKSADEQFDFSTTTLHMKGPIYDIASIVVSSISAGQEMTDLLASDAMQSILTGLYAGFTLSGPIYFGYVGDGLGFGLFNSTDFLIQSTGPLTIGLNLGEDVFLAGGYSFRIPLSADEKHALDLGVMLKGGVRGDLVIEKSFLELPAMFENFSADILLTEPFEFSTIIGVDAGLLYQWDGVGSVGISFQDCYSPTVKYTYTAGLNSFLESGIPVSENGLIPFKMNGGIELNPYMPRVERWISNFRFMLAYDDILDFWLYPSEAEHWLLHLKTGIEITMLEILDVRAGLAEGLLNAGFGLDLQLFELNAAMFGTELASQPGTKPVYNLTIGFTI